MFVTKEIARRVLTEERDNQRNKVYKAERVVWGAARPLKTVEDIEAFLHRMRGKKVLQKRFGWALADPIRVKDGRGTSWARGGAQSINIPLWARNEFVVVHEYAHTITIRLYGSHVAGHGWQFVNVYLQLVNAMMGKQTHDELKASFKSHRVRFTPKKVRKPMEVTPEILARLEKARAARQVKPKIERAV